MKRLAQPLSLYALAAAAGVAHELDEDVGREVLPEDGGAHRAILLSGRQRRAVARELFLAATLSGKPPPLGSIPVGLAVGLLGILVAVLGDHGLHQAAKHGRGLGDDVVWLVPAGRRLPARPVGRVLSQGFS